MTRLAMVLGLALVGMCLTEAYLMGKVQGQLDCQAAQEQALAKQEVGR